MHHGPEPKTYATGIITAAISPLQLPDSARQYRYYARPIYNLMVVRSARSVLSWTQSVSMIPEVVVIDSYLLK